MARFGSVQVELLAKARDLLSAVLLPEGGAPRFRSGHSLGGLGGGCGFEKFLCRSSRLCKAP